MVYSSLCNSLILRITEGVFSGGGSHSLRFCDVISLANLLRGWRKFSKGKRSAPDVVRFELRLEEELFSLHARLSSGTWTNDPYTAKPIADPKPRLIHIASVRDRVFFQAVYQQLYPIFDKTFIHDSYASREVKGTHAGVRRFEVFARKVSANYTRHAFVLKCDVRKFFDHIDHSLLFALISKRITDERVLALLKSILGSFSTPHRPNWIPASVGMTEGKGLPLGNVTSQLFANIYLNELDQFVKHWLKARYYIRYCDDFVMLHKSREVLEAWISNIRDFLRVRLSLELHPHKVTIRKLRQGTDFLGYVSLPHYSVLRTRTKQRMLKRLVVLAQGIRTKEDFETALPVISSYLGMLSHCKGEKLRKEVVKLFSHIRKASSLLQKGK